MISEGGNQRSDFRTGPLAHEDATIASLAISDLSAFQIFLEKLQIASEISKELLPMAVVAAALVAL